MNKIVWYGAALTRQNHPSLSYIHSQKSVSKKTVFLPFIISSSFVAESELKKFLNNPLYCFDFELPHKIFGQLHRVLGQTLVTRFTIAKLALDNPKWVFNFSAHPSLNGIYF